MAYFFGSVEYSQQIGERLDRAGQRERFVQAYSDTSAADCQQRMSRADVEWDTLPVIAWEVKGASVAAVGEERIGYSFSLVDFLSAINSRGFLSWLDEQYLPSVHSKRSGQEVQGEQEAEEEQEQSTGRSRYMHARHRRVALKLEVLT